MTASVHYGHHLVLEFNELRQARFQAVPVLPPVDPGRIGWVVFHEPDGRLYLCTPDGWELLATRADLVGDVAFEHVQALAQAVVTVTHGLGYRPAVSAFSLDYSQQYAEFQTQHLDENTVRVSMDSPRACVLVMS